MADKRYAPKPLPIRDYVPATGPGSLEGLRRPPKGIRRPLLREARAARLRTVKMRTRLQQET